MKSHFASSDAFRLPGWSTKDESAIEVRGKPIGAVKNFLLVLCALTIGTIVYLPLFLVVYILQGWRILAVISRTLRPPSGGAVR